MLPSEYLKKGWTQGANARDSNGDPVDIKSEKAVSWCMVGAIMASDVELDGYLPIHERLIYEIRKIIGIGNRTRLTHYNDAPNRSCDTIIELVEQAEQRLGLNNVTQ